MTTDEKCAAARRQIAEAEAVLLQALASARGVLVSIEAENHELRREALERRTEYYTEHDVAVLLKVSDATVARLRKSGKLSCLRIGGQVRYTAAQLAHVGEVVNAKPPARTWPRRVASRT